MTQFIATCSVKKGESMNGEFTAIIEVAPGGRYWEKKGYEGLA